jgi:hypothetical protein
MPPRFICVALLLYWLAAVVGLVTRDLLPELSVGTPPDLRTISAAGEDAPPARWTIQVVDRPNSSEDRRAVGQAVTESRRVGDGWVEMTSKVVFDSGRLLSSLLKGATLASRVDEQIAFKSRYHVDPSGNLRSFRAEVKLSHQSGGFWEIDGRLKNGVMEVVSAGPLPILNRKMSFEYQPRGVVQSQFGPLDRLPGLHVGQRWEEQVVSPLSGQVETVRAEVKRKTVIHWDRSPVTTLEVHHKSKAVSARTWVRTDGLVLRQEVVMPLLRLVLERQPDRATDHDVSPR